MSVADSEAFGVVGRVLRVDKGVVVGIGRVREQFHNSAPDTALRQCEPSSVLARPALAART